MASRQFRALINNQWYHWTDIPAPTLAEMINLNRPDISMFTDRFDKIGNKIFEGDVLVNNEGLKGKVVWALDHIWQGFELVDIGTGLPLPDIWNQDQWEIKGNVYEGKEYKS